MLLKTLFKTTRPTFLVLSPVCVFLGLSTSLISESQVNLFIFFMILTGAICAHISVNTLNEYFDFKNGLDLKTEKTAFSGGSGALPHNPGAAGSVMALGFASLAITVLIGIYLIIERGTLILPVGIAGVVLILTYNKWLNRSPMLCLIAPGTGFGILMVTGTHLLLTGEYSLLPVLVSLVPFFLINNLLLLNQYPDIAEDASVGRNTFPIAFGTHISNLVYALFLLAAYSLIVFLVISEYLPDLSIIAVIPVAFSVYALFGAIKYGAKIGHFPQYPGANAAAATLTSLLLAITIINGQVHINMI